MSLRIQPCLRSTLVHLSRSIPARSRRVLQTRPRNSPSSARPFLTKSWHRDDAESAAAQLKEPTALSSSELSHVSNLHAIDALQACPGCGALAQTIEPGVAGHYTLKRKVVLGYLKAQHVDISSLVGDTSSSSNSSRKSETEVLEKAVEQADPVLVEEFQLNDLLSSDERATQPTSETPLCDRCHDLLHHSSANPIVHPSVESLYDTMEETAFKYNHIYHVLDAADFPMSLVPKINALLDISPLRSKNRRARQTHFKHGRSAELSFIISRADLLAPQREQVDRLMPTLVAILRDALGSTGQDVRLGNVRCVSAKRGWWVSQLKQEIWNQAGASWMVGKVNVGKSLLFEAVFPKGHSDDLNLRALKEKARLGKPLDWNQISVGNLDSSLQQEQQGRNSLVPPRGATVDDYNEEDNVLLPPRRPETPYPTMPLISSLPGTTASPIRIPFGGGKGELIDLPGLERSNFFDFVQPQHRDGLLMTKRIVPEQQVIRPGQSLMLGGLVRITPVDQDLDFLAYTFMNVKPHLTSTAKAIEFESGARSTAGLSTLITKVDDDNNDHDNDDNDAAATADTAVVSAAAVPLVSAGKFKLKWDETKKRAGPLTARDAGNMKPSILPFRVLSADILVENVGWVEIAVQVRKRRFEKKLTTPTTTSSSSGDGEDGETISNGTISDDDDHLPQVEVFSPEGKYVAVRRPLGAWMLNKPLKKVTRADRRRGKPKRS